jgi:ribosomal protein S11
MFLSKSLLNNINKIKINRINSVVIYKLNLLNTVKKLIQKINYLKQLKRKNTKYINIFLNFNSLITNFKLYNKKNNIFLNTSKNTKSSLLKTNISIFVYVITIQFSSTNTRIYLSDIEGNIKKNYSAGSSNLQGKQKIKRYVAFIAILKQLLIETKFFYKVPIVLHLKNITKNFPIKRIIKLLKNNFTIVSIISFNSNPHNGCRPKKLKRL